MDIFNALPPWAQATVLGLLLASRLLSDLISNTATPAPNTAWGRIYRLLEVVAGIYGRAKQIGIPVVTPQDVVSRLGVALAGGQTLTPEALAEILGKPAPQPAAAGSSVVQTVATIGALLLAAMIGVGLSACADVPLPQDQAQTVYALESAYEAAATVEVNYIASTGADPAVVKAMRAADEPAYDALVAARKAVASHDSAAAAAGISAAESAIGTLTTYLQSKGLLK